MAKSPKAISATFSDVSIYMCHLQVPPLMMPKSVCATSKCHLLLAVPKIH